MEENLSRRNFLKFSGLVGLVLSGCNTLKSPKIVENNSQKIVPKIIKRTSYKLKDLCDTEIDWKNIKLHVYIEPSEILWEHHKYKEGIFEYVKDFFKEQKINCEVVYSESILKKFDNSNEFGIEIWDSKEDKEERYWQLFTGIEEVPEKINLNLIQTSHAVTRAQISLTYGKRQSDTGKNHKEIDKILLELYRKDKEFVLKNHASHFCHEVLHCMGLFHPDGFIDNLIEKTKTPNIMIKNPKYPKPTKQNILGYCLTPLQQKLIHSFIAGNNNYKAFVDSQKDLLFYLMNIAEANDLRLR